PWLEDFSAPWMGYPDHSPDHVRKQIQATYDNGIEGWLLWNAGNSYTESILGKGEAASKADPDFVPPYRTANPDAPPGVAVEKVWPGMPPCKPDRERLEIGRGNLAGSVPPVRAPGGDEPIDCKEEEPATTSTASPSEDPASTSDSASPSDDSTE
ncbi:MAG: putative glycoside hydrolase, partial [Actinobacteria bacterium]|nr:putative glycoside hydrolase [Actinomycetota bacterium]